MIKRNSSKLHIASGPPLTPLRHETMQCTSHAFAKTCIGSVKKKKKKERKEKEKRSAEFMLPRSTTRFLLLIRDTRVFESTIAPLETVTRGTL